MRFSTASSSIYTFVFISNVSNWIIETILAVEFLLLVLVGYRI